MSKLYSHQSFSETKQDFKISWKLLKENWKAFIATIIFAGFFLLFSSAVLFIIAQFIPNFFISEYIRIFASPSTRIITFLSNFFIILAGVLVFFAFLSCQYGLAFDIMSSGDMFAEFKGSFTYFRQHWWQYSLLAILTTWGIFGLASRSPFFTPEQVSHSPIGEPIPPPLKLLARTPFTPEFVGLFISFGIYFVWFVIFINTLPSITAQGHNKKLKNHSQFSQFKNCFLDSFRIFRENPKRVFSTWAIFFLIFFIPLISLTIAANLMYIPFCPSILLDIIRRIIQALWIIFIFIGTPMMSLISTRIYNSIKIENDQVSEKKNNAFVNVKLNDL
ncbi:MAG: hypothetical protein ACTSRG_03340 [Candidatus Helarchaeota archaeon]